MQALSRIRDCICETNSSLDPNIKAADLDAIRYFSDPYEGLAAQLAELKGLVTIVPPLIEADRRRRWDEIGSRWAGQDSGDVIDIYESEAGPEEGWGHADFAWRLCSTAIVTAWELFNFYLARQLSETHLRYNLQEHPILAQLVDEERRAWDRRFDQMVRRYDDFAKIKLAKLPGWDRVILARELRNALVHNLGAYTSSYLSKPDAKLPVAEDWEGFPRDTSDSSLLDKALIPLDREVVEQSIDDLLKFGKQVANSLTPGMH